MAKYSGAEVKQLAYDLTRTGGLALVGHFLKTIAPAPADVDRRA